MSNRAVLRAAIYSRLGLGYGTVNDTKANRALNWAQDNIAKVPFRFLGASKSYVLTEDRIKYPCPTDFSFVDHVILYSDNHTAQKVYPTRRENIEYFDTDYRTWTRLQRYLVGDKVIPTAPLGKQYEATAIATSTWASGGVYIRGQVVLPTVATGYQYRNVDTDYDEAAADSTEPTWPTTLGATVGDGDCTWMCEAIAVDESGVSKNTEPTWPGTIGATVADRDITWTCLHDTTGKGIPACYAISGTELLEATYRQVLWIGRPTADDGNYPAVLHYFQKLPVMDSDDDQSLISRVYEDTPIISGACYKLAKDMEEEELAATYFQEFKIDLADMKQVCPYKLGDDFSAR